jgi:hypothetical protein
MNTNDVERRLEALAAGSASPDLPPAVLDRLAELEAGGAATHAVTSVEAVPLLRRVRVGGSRRARGLTLLGLAAVLALAGTLVYAGSHPGPVRTLEPTMPLQTGPAPEPPFSLGPWRQVYTFGNDWSFGSIYGGGFDSGVSLWWQNDEITGLAERFNAAGQEQTCVLQSKDGTDWTCDELPPPPGEPCDTEQCPTANGLAVHNGRWLAVGWIRVPGSSPSPTPDSLVRPLDWTSSDGKSWSLQPSTPWTPVNTQPELTAGLLATSSGFLGCTATQPGLGTSSDGTTWQPAMFTPGSQPIRCVTVGASSTAGYVASGWCESGSMPHHDCVAYSSDGIRWTTSDPAAGAPSDLASQLRIYPASSPSYIAGRWILTLDTAALPDAEATYYQASSKDGLTWALSPAPRPDFLVSQPGANEADYHPAVFTQSATTGYWAVHSGPREFLGSAMPSPGYSLVPAAPSTYWSATGMNWQPVSDAPPGWPTAMVETPTGLVAFMSTGSNGASTTSVWFAPQK